MHFPFSWSPKASTQPLVDSQLFDENTFYKAFLNDLLMCQNEAIIESPFISSKRMKLLMPILKVLMSRSVRIYVITKKPTEHTGNLAQQSELGIQQFENMGVQVFLCPGSHHRKLAILDRKTLWEGSLNILSQTRSREVMRRMEGEALALQMFNFLKLGRII